jgi:hypothetical protein
VILRCRVGGLGLFRKGILGLGLIMVHFDYDVALQGKMFKVVSKGVLDLVLIMVNGY